MLMSLAKTQRSPRIHGFAVLCLLSPVFSSWRSWRLGASKFWLRPSAAKPRWVIRAIRGSYLLIWSGLASSHHNYLEMLFSCYGLVVQMRTCRRRRPTQISNHQSSIINLKATDPRLPPFGFVSHNRSPAAPSPARPRCARFRARPANWLRFARKSRGRGSGLGCHLADPRSPKPDPFANWLCSYHSLPTQISNHQS